jgi:hypothetical protein
MPLVYQPRGSFVNIFIMFIIKIDLEKRGCYHEYQASTL